MRQSDKGTRVVCRKQRLAGRQGCRAGSRRGRKRDVGKVESRKRTIYLQEWAKAPRGLTTPFKDVHLLATACKPHRIQALRVAQAGNNAGCPWRVQFQHARSKAGKARYRCRPNAFEFDLDVIGRRTRGERDDVVTRQEGRVGNNVLAAGGRADTYRETAPRHLETVTDRIVLIRRRHNRLRDGNITRRARERNDASCFRYAGHQGSIPKSMPLKS